MVAAEDTTTISCERIRVRGVVQGVGFRPAVWELATRLDLRGTVCNDGEGVLIEVQGFSCEIDHLVHELRHNHPPLAHIASIERQLLANTNLPTHFQIMHSNYSAAHTHIAPDAASCATCLQEMSDPDNRRYQYPFTNCTHCGPRLSIVQGIPYDRAQTTMAQFTLCADCQREYDSPNNRRFHAQPNACPVCGPHVCLVDSDGREYSDQSAIEMAGQCLRAGQIVAIKGIGGVHLAVDASNDQAVQRLRLRKQRPHKPLALMVRDLAQLVYYVNLDVKITHALTAPNASIVILTPKIDAPYLSPQLAPQQTQLGFMLAYTPLHHLLMAKLDHPIVLTSGNRSSEPQCITNEQALQQLAGIADAWLLHDRPIANRIDDSVERYIGGKMRVLRRARGYAPLPLMLPIGFEQATDLLALGAEVKNTFCLLKDQQAILSQHIGDLENYATFMDYQQHLQLYQRLYQHRPQALVIDQHPRYQASVFGRDWAKREGLPLIEVQHHHAHLAACLAENQYPLAAPQVLGIVLDGSGYGTDGTLWGGEVLLGHYAAVTRVGSLMPFPLLGGTQAVLQPWRLLYAQLTQIADWSYWREHYPNLKLVRYLQTKPLLVLDKVAKQNINSPLTSSAGRLFDAVAAALSICAEAISYEGQAAIELEALVHDYDLSTIVPYDFGVEATAKFDLATKQEVSFYQLNPAPMWVALLDDLDTGVSKATIAARFQLGFALAWSSMVRQLASHYRVKTIALSGGVLQNRVMLEVLQNDLAPHVTVLSHAQIPANDGGLALGQALVGAAQLMR